MSIAISKLWEMTKTNGLNSKIRQKLQDDTFVTFSILMYAIVYNIDNSKDRLSIINKLKQLIPDIQFKNGIIQKINSFMFHNMAYTYISIRVAHKKYIRPIIKLVSSLFQQKKWLFLTLFQWKSRDYLTLFQPIAPHQHPLTLL